MGRAICRVEGFVTATRAGTGKSGEYYFNISISCGKSAKDENTGLYDNKYQQWWSLTAWGDYAHELERMNIMKGTAISARVENPRARVYHNEKTQKYEAVIEGRLWNFSTAAAVWVKRSSLQPQTGYSGEAPEMDDGYIANLEQGGLGGIQAEIPF